MVTSTQFEGCMQNCSNNLLSSGIATYFLVHV